VCGAAARRASREAVFASGKACVCTSKRNHKMQFRRLWSFKKHMQLCNFKLSLNSSLSLKSVTRAFSSPNHSVSCGSPKLPFRVMDKDRVIPSAFRPEVSLVTVSRTCMKVRQVRTPLERVFEEDVNTTTTATILRLNELRFTITRLIDSVSSYNLLQNGHQTKARCQPSGG
jgi:CHAD domain-containing protein